MEAPYDVFNFEGAKTLNGTIGATITSTQGVAGGTYPQVARITSNAHGLTATYLNPCIYLQNLATAMYNGLHRVVAVGTNTFDVVLDKAFAALTPAGTELWFVGVDYGKDPWELMGFNLHLNAASATSENLVITRDAKAGAIYDVNEYTINMNTVQDLNEEFNPPIKMQGGDIAKFTWANTNSKTWGIKIKARRRW